jgi:hypothetical protein
VVELSWLGRGRRDREGDLIAEVIVEPRGIRGGFKSWLWGELEEE